MEWAKVEERLRTASMNREKVFNSDAARKSIRDKNGDEVYEISLECARLTYNLFFRLLFFFLLNRNAFSGSILYW